MESTRQSLGLAATIIPYCAVFVKILLELAGTSLSCVNPPWRLGVCKTTRRNQKLTVTHCIAMISVISFSQMVQESTIMAGELDRLLEAARKRQITPAESEEQRRSFAYGNTRLENNNITREMIDTAAEDMKLDTKSSKSK
jgi:hypothetical protein